MRIFKSSVSKILFVFALIFAFSQASSIFPLELSGADHGLTNVLGGLTDPKLPPAALDMVFMVNVVHDHVYS